MRFWKIALLNIFIGISCYGCYNDFDDTPGTGSGLEVKQFIWRAMNNYYLYKDEIPELADSYFKDQADLNSFLNEFSTPETLFYEGLVAPQDEFSFLVKDYVALERSLDGINVTNGMQYGLVKYPSGSSSVLGYVRYVIPNSSAEEQGLTRGMLFNTVNGEKLSLDNFSRLLEPRTYTIGLAQIVDGVATSTGETVTLTKQENTNNPIFIARVIDTGESQVGYLMYNAFTGNYDRLLNDTFALFKAEGITDLILDLRYNSGGSVESAVDLASMITGQFKGEVFYTEEWNAEFQEYFLQNEPESLINRFNDQINTGATINSLNLSRLYVITSLRTASASELLINGLDPYIDVIQIGENTRGKFQASTTLYDTPDFGRRGVNPKHTYAVQPLIFKTKNAVGYTDYFDGLIPELEQPEDFENLGVLGEPTEPLLKTALDLILDRPATKKHIRHRNEIVGESGMNDPAYQRMYIENFLPQQKH